MLTGSEAAGLRAVAAGWAVWRFWGSEGWGTIQHGGRRPGMGTRALAARARSQGLPTSAWGEGCNPGFVDRLDPWSLSCRGAGGGTWLEVGALPTGPFTSSNDTREGLHCWNCSISPPCPKAGVGFAGKLCAQGPWRLVTSLRE